jgi:hypothetical protein
MVLYWGNTNGMVTTGFLRELQANLTINATTSNGDGMEEASSSMPWYGLIAVIILVILSAFFNGNNIGTMGMDESYLELLTKGPFESVQEEKEA